MELGSSKKSSDDQSALKGRKRPWSEEEDNLVIKLVEEYGPQKWTFIAEHLPGRIGKQCRERWHNHLNPKIKKEAWTDAEEWLLYLVHKTIGNKWAEIAKIVTGRTDNSIKNHWNSSMKKKIPEFFLKFLEAKSNWMIKSHNYLKSCPYDERTLLEQLFSMGDLDFHTLNGLNPEISKSAKTRQSKSNSLNNIPTPKKSPNLTFKEKNPHISPTKTLLYQDLYTRLLKSKGNKELLEKLKTTFKTDKLENILSSENLKNPETFQIIQSVFDAKKLSKILRNRDMNTPLSASNKKMGKIETSLFFYESPNQSESKVGEHRQETKKKNYSASTFDSSASIVKHQKRYSTTRLTHDEFLYTPPHKKVHSKDESNFSHMEAFATSQYDGVLETPFKQEFDSPSKLMTMFTPERSVSRRNVMTSSKKSISEYDIIKSPTFFINQLINFKRFLINFI